MAQETVMGAKDQHTQHDHIEDDEVSELLRPPSLYRKVREQAERFASTRLGQFVIERADRALKLIEDTTKWSLPQDKNSSGVGVLERPLPWAPFLLLIILLRLARIWLSIGALMIGNGPISPTDMIYFIQTRRRKLRSIRVQGLRVMRNRQQESSSLSGRSFTQQLSHWLTKAICRPGVQRANSGRLFGERSSVEKKETTTQQNQSVSKRPRDDDSNVDHNLTIDEMLAKYANANSEDDSDFVPNAEDENESSSSSSDSSEDISSNEEQQNVEEHKTMNDVLLRNGVHNKSAEQDSENDKEKETTSNGNSNDKEQETEVAQRVIQMKEDQWKSTPGHLSAALLNTRLYNNTAAAANTDPVQLQVQPNSNSNSNSTIQSDNVPDPDNDSNTDTDSSSSTTGTVSPNQLPQQKAEPHTPTETTITSEDTQPSTHPTIETLTPATSSEDIFYSPIGSPNNFNRGYVPIKNASINAVTIHSTPNSELEDQLSAGSELEEAARQSISLAHDADKYGATPPAPQPQVYKQQHQQQQRQFNHPHQRFRGRNRR